jgi:hypothetical protein
VAHQAEQHEDRYVLWKMKSEANQRHGRSKPGRKSRLAKLLLP